MLVRLSILLYIILLLPPELTAQTANRFDIVINELFPDPSPAVGLPNSEFIELRNVSITAFNLHYWKLSDGNNTATINANFILQPDSFVIICTNSAADLYALFGNTIGVSNFPSLDNDSDIIALYSPEGKVIHAVGYRNDWFQNDVKSEGGWTLELTDSKNPCAGITNWKASIDVTGGTPGKENSVTESNPDDLPPALLRAYTLDSTTIVAVFDEPLDSISAATASNYSIDHAIGSSISATPLTPLFTEVVLQLPAPLVTGTVYTLAVKNLPDCTGNNIGLANKTKTGLPQPAAGFDIVINEFLFNPKPGGYDYIELYNRSNKIADLKQLYIANRNITGNLTNIKQLSTTSTLFFPGDYIVLTENGKWLQQNYVVKDPSRLFELSSFPSLPDDKGTIVLINLQGTVTDELQYDNKWHFALIDNDEGIALERINYNQPTQEKDNWTSAASTAGYGTPGYQNSQLRADLQAQGVVTVSPAIFSPDNNGIDDFVSVQYTMQGPGYVANITIFDVAGKPVRYLTKNATLGITGTFNWNGLNDKLQPLPVGMYIILTEIFNLQGKTKKFKNVVTLARKF